MVPATIIGTLINSISPPFLDFGHFLLYSVKKIVVLPVTSWSPDSFFL